MSVRPITKGVIRGSFIALLGRTTRFFNYTGFLQIYSLASVSEAKGCVEFVLTKQGVGRPGDFVRGVCKVRFAIRNEECFTSEALGDEALVIFWIDVCRLSIVVCSGGRVSSIYVNRDACFLYRFARL